ncbi:MAG: DNA polymerase III subunit delta [Nitrospirota bacterium]|nr:DNA polymerase III subunit delta [Nitrospirota bacterium]
MKPSDVQTALQRNGLAPLYLVVGEEDYLRDQVIGMIRAHALQSEKGTDQQTPESLNDSTFSCEILYGDETDAQDVLSRVETLSFFSNHQVVILKWAEKLSAREGEGLIPYFQAPNPSSTLVLSASKLDGRLKWAQTVKKYAVVIESTPLYENQRLGWVRNEAARAGLRLDGEAAQMLKECANDGLYSVRREMDKLALYVTSGHTVSSRDIQAVQGKEPGVSVFDLAGAIARGQHGEALLIFEKNVDAGEAPLRILGALVWQYRRLWKAREGLALGLSESMAGREAGIPPFRQQEFLTVAKQFSLSHFRQAFELFAKVDMALKGGSAGSPRRILSSLLVWLCQQSKTTVNVGRSQKRVEAKSSFTKT